MHRTVLLAALIALPGCSSSSPPAGDPVPPGFDGSVSALDGHVAPSGDDAQVAPTSVRGGDASDVDATANADASPLAAGRGATQPYVEYEAEDGTTNGTKLGPSRSVNETDTFSNIAGESSGRQAVKLSEIGQYVRFTTRSAANSLVVRFAIPDSQDGSGLQATLGFYVNGTRMASLALTSKYAWAYGNPQTGDTTTNNPADGYAHHFYDEARLLLPSDIPAGSTVALQQDAQDSSPYYVIDLLDLEDVAPALAQPSGTVSVMSYGAKGDGVTDDGQAIQNAINDAQSMGQGVWIPPGTYVDDGTVLNVKNVAVRGAGMWRSTITGASARFVCGGMSCVLSNVALLGGVTLRDDSATVPGISGVFGAGSVLENVWVEHFTTGAWVGVNGNMPPSSLVVRGARIRDTFADGINFANGTSNSTIEQSSARGTGDDGFASWSFAGAGDPANTNNLFRFDTVQAPWRANCFAIYGGTGNAIEDDLCADAVTYPGIFVDQEFNSRPFSGTTSIARDTILRSGGPMFGQQWGALTVSGHDVGSPITGVSISDVDIEQATFAGLTFTGPNDAIDGLSLRDLTITQPGTYGIQVAATASGSATAANVVVTGPGTGGLQNDAGAAWTFTRDSGDLGW